MKFRQLTAGQRLLVLLALILIGDTLVLVTKLRINGGTLLPACIGVYLLIPVVARDWLAQNLKRSRLFALVWHGVRLCALLALGGLIVFVIAAWPHADGAEGQTPAAIVVLGAGLKGDVPSPLLVNRLNVAAGLAQRFPDAAIVVSGGHGMLETTTEAQAMRSYLMERGVAERRILPEDKSGTTYENLRFSQKVLATHAIDAGRDSLIIVTSDFHVMRAGQLARKAGYAQARLVASPTPASIVPNVWLREFGAYIKAWLRQDI